jgi:phage tail protein X
MYAHYTQSETVTRDHNGLAEARQVQRHIIGATLPTRNITARLKINLVRPAGRRSTSQEVELSSPWTSGSSDDCVALETPPSRSSGGVERQWLVRSRSGNYVQILCWRARDQGDRTADDETGRRRL